MPDPTRPVAGAPIATDWGQAVHDATFQPLGVRVAGGASTAVGTAFEQLQLNTATDDPGGWLAADALTVPSGAGGLYLFYLEVLTDNGSASERTRVALYVNGSVLVSWNIDNEGVNAVIQGTSGLVELAAGDVITAWAAKTGGLDPDVTVRALGFLRLGTSIGA